MIGLKNITKTFTNAAFSLGLDTRLHGDDSDMAPVLTLLSLLGEILIKGI